MKRKLTIAAGIIHSPAVLFLDEPTTGLDVASARQVRQLVTDLNAGGTTVFLTTHYIEEAERLCRRIAFIVAGRIVRVDAIEALMAPAQGRHVMEFALGADAQVSEAALGETFPGLEARVLGEGWMRVESGEPLQIGPLVRFFEGRGLSVLEARLARPMLEEVFVRVTGIEAGAMKREKERSGGGA
jgi:ABC-2 type transport system ATP-binding protein